RLLKGRTRRGYVDWAEHYEGVADQEGPEHGGVQRKGELVGASSLSCSDLNDGVITQLILERGDSAGSPRAIMQDGKREPADRAGLGGRLSIQNRVFLALLWGLADRYGIVRNTGLSGLGEMAGNMTRDQVCSQLAKLERLGYVKSRVGGISASRIFGRSEGAI